MITKITIGVLALLVIYLLLKVRRMDSSHSEFANLTLKWIDQHKELVQQHAEMGKGCAVMAKNQYKIAQWINQQAEKSDDS